jgi:hypothetical protein
MNFALSMVDEYFESIRNEWMKLAGTRVLGSIDVSFFSYYPYHTPHFFLILIERGMTQSERNHRAAMSHSRKKKR